MFCLLFFCFFATTIALNAAEITELQKLRTIVSVLNGGDVTGMALEWQTGDLSNACTFLGIFCSVDGHIEAMITQAFFQATGDNQIFSPSEVDYTKFPNLRQIIIRNRQMTGDFNFKLSPGMIIFRLIGDLSTSETGGYTMVGTLPSNLFDSMTNLIELEISYFPKLTGNFPGVFDLSFLRIFSLAHVSISGPFPVIPFVNGRQITIVDTKLSGLLPAEYCVALNSFYSETDPNLLLIGENPNLTDLPDCVKSCTSSPIYTLCAIKLNNVCDVGQPLSDDVTIDVGITGAAFGGCVLDDDNPCTISRDNELCLDCTGEPDSGYTYDSCGVCNKENDPNRNACLDCQGIPFGTYEYDICGVCEGNANTCYDCFGVPAGSSLYDICGVCEGHGQSCDCAGVTGGTSVEDDCGICNGNNACYDCLGVPHGSSTYDLCDVCNGLSNTCSDCSGVPAGTKVYDLCDVCGGDGSQCDCAGVHLGFTVLDACGVCGGDGSTCADCNGVPNGTSVYDVCDVCNGSDTVIPCENPPDNNSAIQEVERTSTFVFIIIISVLALICLITMIVLAATMRRKPQAAEPLLEQRSRNGGGGGHSFNKTATLLVLSLAFAPTPGECVLPQTTQFFESIASHTNAIDVYPEWFVGANVVQFCSVSLPDLTCTGQDIDGVALTRPLIGSYGDTETQFISLLPLITSFSVKNSPQLQFTLDGIGETVLLTDFEILDSGLKGTIPADIGLCSSLTSLVISNTKVGGSLPLEVGELTLLRNLTISRSELTSVALVPFGNLNAVTYLDLRSNNMFEFLPVSIRDMGSLVELHLANNRFYGQIPGTYRDLSLTILDLSKNFLSVAHVGLFSGTPGPIQASLEILKLDRNIFGSRLPNLTGFSKLKHIGLSHNFFGSDYAGVLGFYYGETGGTPTVVLANNNAFKSLRPFLSQPFFGECNFTSNYLCTDTVLIDPMYFSSQCDLGLRPHDCPPAQCGDASCHDCLGRPNGASTYDVCDICAGSGTTCLDCAGTPNGPLVYDACHVCNGDDSSCADCNGVPNGSAFYDGCDVCGGDDSTCADCAGVPFGLSVYDACDVCNGRGHTCLDCLGVLLGTSKFDECGVCNGDGLSCADPLILDYLTHKGSFTTFVLLAVLLAVLVVIAGVLMYFICTL